MVKTFCRRHTGC